MLISGMSSSQKATTDKNIEAMKKIVMKNRGNTTIEVAIFRFGHRTCEAEILTNRVVG